MKTLEDQTLLYNEDCLLCRAYTLGFIKAGMLDENGKKSYSITWVIYRIIALVIFLNLN